MVKRTKAPTISTNAPPHLTPEARAWFDKFVKEYGVTDEAGLLLLRTAMESFDRANEARQVLSKEGITVKDKYGQHRPHPAAGIERDARKNMLAFLRALNLDVEPTKIGPGRPPGR